MTKRISKKPVDKSKYSNYLQKSIENYEASVKTLEKGAHNAAAVSAVHSAISAVDAYCVYGLGQRCTSPKHEDAADLIITTPFNDKEKALVSKKFKSIIKIKNMAEYEERLVKPKDAGKAVREAGELLEIISNRVEAE